MFRDRDRVSAHFMETDIIRPNAALQALEGTIDVIPVMRFFISGIGTRR